MGNEIKFGCPHCSQHIACDAGYRDFTIDCPACGNSMVVPHLTAADPSHPPMLVVASRPGPKRPESAAPPVLKAWTESEWERHSKEFSGRAEKTAPHWILAFIGTIIAAFVLQINHAGPWAIILCLIAGGVLSGVFIARDRKSAEAHALIKGLGIALVVALLIPIVALGILFIGCLAVMR